MKHQITGRTKLLGVVGTPIEHSLSPAIHNKASELLGEDYIYLAFDVKGDEIGDAIQAMRTLGICGYSVTMPCKRKVIPYLDEISTEAKLMNAVNTVVNDDGILKGYNTDGYGMLKSIEQAGATLTNNTMTIFGTGGAATAILVQAVLDGMKEIFVVGRKEQPLPEQQEILSSLQEEYPNCNIYYGNFDDINYIDKAVTTSQILINGTPLGMIPQEQETPLKNIDLLRADHFVADAVYNPRETVFLKNAKQAGATTIPGVHMLLWQGVRAYYLFTGKEMPVKEVEKAIFPKE